MQVKDIDINKLAHYLKIELNNYEDADRKKEEDFLKEILISAKNIIKKNDGLSDEELENSESLNIPIYILCAEMYDKRSLTDDKNNLNKVLDITMGLDDKNLL